MHRPLLGKRALITGSTQGLGLSMARRLAANGSDVVVHGLSEADGVRAARDIERDFGVRARQSSADLRDPSQIVALLSESAAAFGAIHILINNAVTRHTAPVDELRPDQWDDALAVNLSAAFHTIRLAMPGMKAAGWGRIVNVSSIYGLRGAVNRVAYVTTKTALIGLTRVVALEAAKSGVTCNAICPGTSESPIHESAIEAIATNEGLTRAAAEARALAGKQPTARLISADGVAAFVVFLCSDGAADITGAVLPIDAGWSAG